MLIRLHGLHESYTGDRQADPNSLKQGQVSEDHPVFSQAPIAKSDGMDEKSDSRDEEVGWCTVTFTACLQTR